MSILADVVLLAHLAFVVFVVLGGFLVARRPWIALAHMPAAIWGALVELNGWRCPLTPLEFALRRAAGAHDAERDLLDRIVSAVLYPAALTRETQVVLGVAVVVLNIALYARAFRVRARR